MSATVSAVVLYPKKYTRPASCETIETTPKLSSFSHFPHLPQMVSYVGKHRSLTFGAYIEISSHFNCCCSSRAVGAASKASKETVETNPADMTSLLIALSGLIGLFVLFIGVAEFITRM